MKTTPTTPREHLAQDAFRIEERLALFGRPVGVIIVGAWMPDGACEAMVGMVSLEPLDFCRIVAAVRFVPDEGLSVVRTTEPDDPRDDDEVISRFFERPLDEIIGTAFLPLGGALAAAAEIREQRAGGRDERPVCESAAPAWVH